MHAGPRGLARDQRCRHDHGGPGHRRGLSKDSQTIVYTRIYYDNDNSNNDNDSNSNEHYNAINYIFSTIATTASSTTTTTTNDNDNNDDNNNNTDSYDIIISFNIDLMNVTTTPT